MAKVAVLMAEGFEESETLTIVDLLRRANIECKTFSFEDEFVKGMHNIYIKADQIFNDSIKDFDVLVLPGGRPGGDNLRNNPEVIKLVRLFNKENKYLAAMCSGTVVLSDAKVIEGKKVTGYTGYDKKLIGGIFVNDVAVLDQNIITSQGPATPYPFAFKIIEALGQNVDEMKEKLLYNFSRGK
ncbi:MAG: DJ-1/PfpI family protein [Thomasclavelia sp.]|jgi:4-methyl-5(b-hydroxyethyl)-thiazole monophosphate biosynthesis|nr:DJ-1/PfpI family protein [Thomasclavelia sp.]